MTSCNPKVAESCFVSCFVCCDPFNNSTRAKIDCCNDKCLFKACKSCIRQYLLSTSKDPHCMDCKIAWSQKSIIEKMNRSFYNNDFKKHRKQLLLDIEMSKLPDTMAAAEKYREIKAKEGLINDLDKELVELRSRIMVINRAKSSHATEIYRLKNQVEGVKEEKRKFIMACPNNECRGYLSTQYKCEMCKTYTCHDCLEIIGHNKTDQHICNPDLVKTAEAIKKDTKPCPNCGIRIFKISGCDQIWCTECQVAFSWNTGKIENGVIHNPHFYEHQRKINGGQAPRTPGDNPCGGEGNFCSYYLFRSNIIAKFRIDLFDNADLYNYSVTNITNFHRYVSHIINTNLRDTRAKIQELSNNEDIRVKYIVNEKSKEELATHIFRNDNLRKKHNECLHLYELISVVATETFATLTNSKNTGKKFIGETVELVEQFHVLQTYCNEQFAEISKIYNHQVLQVDKNFTMTTKKFSITSRVKKAVEHDDALDENTIKKTRNTSRNKSKSAAAGCSTDPL